MQYKNLLALLNNIPPEISAVSHWRYQRLTAVALTPLTVWLVIFLHKALHAPYADLQANVSAGGMLQELAAATGKRIVFYCAFGERSAMAVAAAQAAGLTSACHIEGGIAAWKKANGPLAR